MGFVMVPLNKCGPVFSDVIILHFLSKKPVGLLSNQAKIYLYFWAPTSRGCSKEGGWGFVKIA